MLRGSKPGCPGCCEVRAKKHCGGQDPYYITKHVIDGIWLVFGVNLAGWFDSLELATSYDRGPLNVPVSMLFRIIGLILFVKIGLEIATIVIRCDCCKQANPIQQPGLVTVVGQPVQLGQTSNNDNRVQAWAT